MIAESVKFCKYRGTATDLETRTTKLLEPEEWLRER
jgi:hypothetical protein